MAIRRRALVLLGVAAAVGLLVGGVYGWRRQTCRLAILAAGSGQYESRLAAQRRLVDYGDRCIDPVIETLAEQSPWTRSTVALPGVLGQIGEEARARLTEAIDRATAPDTRAYLIWTLYSGFQDSSRLDLLHRDAQAGRLSDWTSTHLKEHLRPAPPPAPASP